jgi:hypothetical protein
MRRSLVFAMAASLLLGAGIADVDAASKKRKKWVDFTPKERAQLMVEARKACRKRFGATVGRIQIDYFHEMIWCYEN